MRKKEFSTIVFTTLKKKYPNIHSFLNHDSVFQLLMAVILSAQCTDARVNKVTPVLFKQFGDIEKMATASVQDIISLIQSVSYFNTKASHLILCAKKLKNEFNGIVPNTLETLITLPGVGRKTANVVLGQGFGKPGITVDTHVKRLSRRMGFTKEKNPIKIEFDLQKLWPISWWSDYSTVLILHARETCKAIKPRCDLCEFSHHCPKKM
jgi:endonuclease-3